MITEDARTWRELADQLDADERRSFEDWEQGLTESGSLTPKAQASLLEQARYSISARLADAAYADVPPPPGVTDVGEWEQDSDGWSRALVWREFGGGSLCIDGRQNSDGTHERAISLYDAVDGMTLDAGEARRLAALLIQAADALDELTGDR